MADEYCEAVTRLWESWEPDAMIIDQEREIFADPRKSPPGALRGQVLQHSRSAVGPGAHLRDGR